MTHPEAKLSWVSLFFKDIGRQCSTALSYGQVFVHQSPLIYTNVLEYFGLIIFD